jgi:hypothetical protein
MMGEITVDGERFDVKQVGRDQYIASFILKIQLHNRNDVDVKHHKLDRLVCRGERSDVTDGDIQRELEVFSEEHPDAEIQSFGVIEERTAREAKKISHD